MHPRRGFDLLVQLPGGDLVPGHPLLARVHGARIWLAVTSHTSLDVDLHGERGLPVRSVFSMFRTASPQQKIFEASPPSSSASMMFPLVSVSRRGSPHPRHAHQCLPSRLPARIAFTRRRHPKHLSTIATSLSRTMHVPLLSTRFVVRSSDGLADSGDRAVGGRS